jgi:hypothetical protein
MEHSKKETDEIRLHAAMQWLCRAQDSSSSGGVSGGYEPEKGWRPPYPETTGYIIPTFIKYARLTGEGDYLDRAKRMGDWELGIQLPEGGVRGGVGLKEHPIVFDTGQVIHGWVSLHEETDDVRYLRAAARAGDWLVKIQDEDGKWSKNVFMNTPHAYHSRVAWPLLRLYAITGDESYKNAAESNVRWVLGLARSNGWIPLMGFTPDETPFTHTIAYTFRGLFECAQLLGGDTKARAISVVSDVTSRIIQSFKLDSEKAARPVFLPGAINHRWKSWARYSCVTGNAQFAILFLKIYGQNRDEKYLRSGLNLIDSVGAAQDLNSSDPGVRGAIPGSQPIGGKYQRNRYPNWAAKFFADSLMLERWSRTIADGGV